MDCAVETSVNKLDSDSKYEEIISSLDFDMNELRKIKEYEEKFLHMVKEEAKTSSANTTQLSSSLKLIDTSDVHLFNYSENCNSVNNAEEEEEIDVVNLSTDELTNNFIFPVSSCQSLRENVKEKAGENINSEDIEEIIDVTSIVAGQNMTSTSGSPKSSSLLTSFHRQNARTQQSGNIDVETGEDTDIISDNQKVLRPRKRSRGQREESTKISGTNNNSSSVFLLASTHAHKQTSYNLRNAKDSDETVDIISVTSEENMLVSRLQKRFRQKSSTGTASLPPSDHEFTKMQPVEDCEEVIDVVTVAQSPRNNEAETQPKIAAHNASIVGTRKRGRLQNEESLVAGNDVFPCSVVLDSTAVWPSGRKNARNQSSSTENEDFEKNIDVVSVSSTQNVTSGIAGLRKQTRKRRRRSLGENEAGDVTSSVLGSWMPTQNSPGEMESHQDVITSTLGSEKRTRQYKHNCLRGSHGEEEGIDHIISLVPRQNFVEEDATVLLDTATATATTSGIQQRRPELQNSSEEHNVTYVENPEESVTFTPGELMQQSEDSDSENEEVDVVNINDGQNSSVIFINCSKRRLKRIARQRRKMLSKYNRSREPTVDVTSSDSIVTIDLVNTSTTAIRPNMSDSIIEIPDTPIKSTKSAPKVSDVISIEDDEEVPSAKPDKVRRIGLGDCPVCLQDLTNKEKMSTICGHIFCSKCIRNVIKTTKKCPNCRKHLTLKSIHPIFI